MTNGQKSKMKREAEWAEASRRCRLSEKDVRMAKDLGLSPRSLIKNIPNPSERWKGPVHLWVREMYHKRQENLARKKAEKRQDTRVDARTQSDV